MTIASAIQAKQQQVAAAYTAISNKGGTLPATQDLSNMPNAINTISTGGTINSLNVTPTTSAQTITASGGVDGYSPVNVSAVTASIDSNIQPANIKKDVVILGTTGTYEGGGGGKYQLLQRVKDDNNADVGIVSGFFTDANDTEYAVVCLDAVNRTPANYANWCTNQALVTNLPAYQNQTLWSAKETATFNTQKILDFLSGSYTSGACTICRSKSFVIDGITYYGQLPNIMELVDIFRHRIEINSSDPTASSYSTKIIPTATIVWSSSQVDATLAFIVNENGTVGRTSKNYVRMAIPVLEIPNT